MSDPALKVVDSIAPEVWEREDELRAAFEDGIKRGERMIIFWVAADGPDTVQVTAHYTRRVTRVRFTEMCALLIAKLYLWITP